MPRAERIVRHLAACAAFLLMTDHARAVEGGQTAYASGLDTELAAIVPAPGQTLGQVYMLGVGASKLAGDNGNNTQQDFHTRGFGLALRFLHTWKLDLGDYKITSAGAPIFQSVSVRLNGRRYRATGFNELYLQPAILSRSFGKLHTFVSEDVYVPVGQHTPSSPVTTSVGYYALSTSVAATWLPDRHWDLSTWWSYTIPLRDTAFNYHSGQTLNIDFGATYQPLGWFPHQLAFGVNGYFLKQMTDDKSNGTVYNNGNRIQQAALGGHATWFLSQGSAISFKVQKQFATRNTVEGTRLWLLLMAPI